MRTVLLSLFIAFSLTGCWMMPYQESFSCNSDLGTGRCGMLRDNYNYDEINAKTSFKYIFDENLTKKVKLKEIAKDDCSKYTDNIVAFHECQQKYEYIILRKTKE